MFDVGTKGSLRDLPLTPLAIIKNQSHQNLLKQHRKEKQHGASFFLEASDCGYSEFKLNNCQQLWA